MAAPKTKSPKEPWTPKTHRDSLDFRDLIYMPTLATLRFERIPKRDELPKVRDQGSAGSCTGFGLAAVIDYLIKRRDPNAKDRVSARMLYEMAKLHDQWEGEDYEGSSARGAMKGWNKHGVCLEAQWPYVASRRGGYLDPTRERAALRYPVGAYYRVLPRRSDVHAALHEVGAVYASADIHIGWESADGKPDIRWTGAQRKLGGHAFAIVGYTEDGFLVFNSWGERWGGWRDPASGDVLPGVALWSYPDFDANIWDIWVANLALPVKSLTELRSDRFRGRSERVEIIDRAPPRHEIARHYLHIDDGEFDKRGDFPSRVEDAEEIAKLIEANAASQQPGISHLLLYAHGGLNDVKGSAQRVSKWRPVFEANGIHELHFIWETGLLEELGDLIKSKIPFLRERAGGDGSWWDNWVERATSGVGHAFWMEMKRGAERAFASNGAGTAAIKPLISSLNKLKSKAPKVHLVGHSAGSIWHAHLIQRWVQLRGPKIENLVLFAPACTHDLFHSHILPELQSKRVGKLHHFLLDDPTEQKDNVALVYRKSLLYLVSNAYENKKRTKIPILGMEAFLEPLKPLLKSLGASTYTTAKNRGMTASKSHGGFDNDEPTMNAMLELVVGTKTSAPFEAGHLTGY